MHDMVPVAPYLVPRSYHAQPLVLSRAPLHPRRQRRSSGSRCRQP